MSSQTTQKALIAFAYLLVPCALISLVVSPAQQPEIDIFASAPLFWVFILAALAAFMASVIWQAHCRMYSNFKFSFLGLILTSSAILCLPVLRGYFLYGGNDPYGHFQTIVSIIGSGSFSTDFYPFSQVFAAEIAQITSLPPQTAEGLVMPILSLLFALFIYCLATAVCQGRERILLAAAIGFIPLFSYYGVAFYPDGAAILMLPLAFYLAFKVRNDRGYAPLLIVVLLIFPFIHPLISLVLVLCLFSMFFAEAILKGRRVITRTHLSFTMGLLAAFAWFAWFYVQKAENSFASNVIAWLMGERVTIPRTAELEGASSLGLQAETVLVLKTYGVQIFGCAISVIAIGIILLHFYRRDKNIGNYFIVAVAAIATTLGSLFLFAGTAEETLGRFFSASPAWAWIPILAALPLSIVNDKRKYGALLVGAIIIIPSFLAVGAVFRSPWISQVNWDFTYQDNALQNWYTPLIGTYGYAQIAFPVGNTPTQSWSWVAEQPILPHFGYTNHTTLRSSLSNDSLIAFGEDRQLAVAENPALNNSPVMGIYGFPAITQVDINKLQNDRSVNVIYTTGADEVLLVN
jgi:hypothetical protein